MKKRFAQAAKSLGSHCDIDSRLLVLLYARSVRTIPGSIIAEAFWSRTFFQRAVKMPIAMF